MGTVSAVCKKRKAAGQRPFSSAEWSSRGHAQGKGLAECPGETLRKHRSEDHDACTLFQWCFVSGETGFVGGEALALWRRRNT
jgi:hypothetical protein